VSLSRNGSALGAFYRRMCAHMDKPRANTAVAHKLARMIYVMLTRGQDDVDQGQQHGEEQQRERSIATLKRRAADLGFSIAPRVAAVYKSGSRCLFLKRLRTPLERYRNLHRLLWPRLEKYLTSFSGRRSTSPDAEGTSSRTLVPHRLLSLKRKWISYSLPAAGAN
jgi:hypothetical protein